ncbi:hypothetical protein BZA77DRAFT_365428 [Pyronema omphalodes]|nr:hypothetical protein BZA77DRAFT_365428 [Pyronema omphalodes]
MKISTLNPGTSYMKKKLSIIFLLALNALHGNCENATAPSYTTNNNAINHTATDLITTETNTTSSSAATGIRAISLTEHDRAPTDIEALEICQSPQFEPTLANFQEAGVYKWMIQFNRENSDTEFYLRHGMLPTIANNYLGLNNYKCALGTSHQCRTDCPTVVKSIGDLDLARKVFFTLASGQNLLTVGELVYDGIESAQLNMMGIIPRMSLENFMLSKTPQEQEKAKAMAFFAGLINWAVTNIIQTITPFLPFKGIVDSIIGEFEKIYADQNDAQITQFWGEVWEGHGNVPATWINHVDDDSFAPTKLAKHRLGIGKFREDVDGILNTRLYKEASDRLWAIGLNVALPIYLRDWIESFQVPSPDSPHDANVAMVSSMVQETGRFARRRLKENFAYVFGPGASSVKADGTSYLTNILGVGTFLPVDSSVLSQWTSATVEDTMTQNMYMKTLNAALRAQKHFISCTPDFRHKDRRSTFSKPGVVAPNCYADNTGPANSKACINGEVCYFYRWSDRGLPNAHHVEDPVGLNRMASNALTIGDIIESSVKTADSNAAQDGEVALYDTSGFRTVMTGPTADHLTNSSTVGLFTVPVCHTPYNWNGPTDGYENSNDDDLYSSRKSLPCYCGPLGRDSASVWSAMRLESSTGLEEYQNFLCPRLIKAKIHNRLERNIARCRLGISHGWNGLGFQGKVPDHLCPLFLSEIDARGYTSIDQIPQKVQDILVCKIKHDKSKGCKPYIKTPIADAWKEAGFDDTIPLDVDFKDDDEPSGLLEIGDGSESNDNEEQASTEEKEEEEKPIDYAARIKPAEGGKTYTKTRTFAPLSTATSSDDASSATAATSEAISSTTATSVAASTTTSESSAATESATA